MRLDKAAANCWSTASWPWARVSKEVGYSSVSHFIAEFRARFGVTPPGPYCDGALAVARAGQRARAAQAAQPRPAEGGARAPRAGRRQHLRRIPDITARARTAALRRNGQ